MDPGEDFRQRLGGSRCGNGGNAADGFIDKYGISTPRRLIRGGVPDRCCHGSCEAFGDVGDRSERDVEVRREVDERVLDALRWHVARTVGMKDALAFHEGDSLWAVESVTRRAQNDSHSCREDHRLAFAGRTTAAEALSHDFRAGRW